MGEEDGNRKGMAGVCSESVILRVLKAGSLGEVLGKVLNRIFISFFRVSFQDCGHH